MLGNVASCTIPYGLRQPDQTNRYGQDEDSQNYLDQHLVTPRRVRSVC